MINLRKGDSPVILDKTQISSVHLACSWSSNTDYDLYALVLYAGGRIETVATFGAETKPTRSNKAVDPRMKTCDGAVSHMGDVGRGKKNATEIIEIVPNDTIRAVVPVCYSAQSNGTGSFFKYRVSMVVDGGTGQQVSIKADNALRDDLIYTCVPGWIENTPGGILVHPYERYSRPGSEYRPIVRFRKKGLLGRITDEVEIVMDAGPRNDYK